MRALNFVNLPLCIIDLKPQRPACNGASFDWQSNGGAEELNSLYEKIVGGGIVWDLTPAAALRPPSTKYRTCIIQDPPLVERSKQALSGWALVWPRAFRFQVHMQGCFRQVCFFLPMKMFRPFECNAFGKFVRRILSDRKSNTYTLDTFRLILSKGK